MSQKAVGSPPRSPEASRLSPQQRRADQSLSPKHRLHNSLSGFDERKITLSNAVPETATMKPVVLQKHEFVQELRRISEILRDTTTVDWEQRSAALTLVARLALGCTEPALLAENINMIRPAMITQLQDLRSAVVKHAFLVVKILGILLHNHFDTFAEAVVLTALPIYAKNSITSAAALDCMQSLVRNCDPARFLQPVLEGMRDKRNHLLRVGCMTLLEDIMEHNVTPSVARHADAISTVVKNGLTDSTKEVRTSSKKCFERMADVWPLSAMKLFDALDLSIIKRMKIAAPVVTSTRPATAMPRMPRRALSVSTPTDGDYDHHAEGGAGAQTPQGKLIRGQPATPKTRKKSRADPLWQSASPVVNHKVEDSHQAPLLARQRSITPPRGQQPLTARSAAPRPVHRRTSSSEQASRTHRRQLSETASLVSKSNGLTEEDAPLPQHVTTRTSRRGSTKPRRSSAGETQLNATEHDVSTIQSTAEQQRAQVAALHEELSQSEHKDTLEGLRKALADEHPQWQTFLDSIRERSGSHQSHILLAKDTCGVLKHLCTVLDERFTPIALINLPSLLQLASHPQLDMSAAANSCVRDIIRMRGGFGLFPALVHKYKQSGNSVLAKQRLLEFMTLMLNYEPFVRSDVFETIQRQEDVLGALEMVVLVALKDNSPDVRGKARELYAACNELWPERAERISKKLPPTMQQQLASQVFASQQKKGSDCARPTPPRKRSILPSAVDSLPVNGSGVLPVVAAEGETVARTARSLSPLSDSDSVVIVHDPVPVRTLTAEALSPQLDERTDTPSPDNLGDSHNPSKRKTLESLPFLDNLDDSRDADFLDEDVTADTESDGTMLS